MHIGNARIAIINYLFSKKNNGKFLFRIDDTDAVRSRKEYEDSIKEDLKWLGISYNEFFRQSERIFRYKEVMNKLIQKGVLYKCFETQEELDFKRKNAISKGNPPVYDRTSLKLSNAEKKKLEDSGAPFYWRFKLPSKVVSWNDIVLGEIRYDLESVSDPVVVKTDGTYLYTFSSVVDDFDSEISHIIRGQDHVTNTAVQIAIFDEISDYKYKVDFAHLSLLVNKDGSQFSKRLGSLNLGNIRDMGIDPMAINNLLATLGSSLDTIAFQTLQELEEYFDISKFSSNSPKFDLVDILKLNKKILHNKEYSDFEKILGNGFIKSQKAFYIIRANIESYNDFSKWNEILSNNFKSNSEFSNYEKNIFKKAAYLLVDVKEITSESVSKFLVDLTKIINVSGKSLYMPIRKALTGQEHGPNIVELFCLFSKDDLLRRFNTILENPTL
jgi:glutamyl-tRNA synthetase